jgi:hypothetical protein
VDTCAEQRFEHSVGTLAALGVSAILALVAGALVYMLDRDWGSTLFLAHWVQWQPDGAGPFGALGNSLPSLFHAYAFALLLIMLLGRTLRARLVGTLLWFTTASALECLQVDTVKTWLAHAPGFPNDTTFLAGIHAYIVNGYFDPGDLVAAGLGCCSAFAVSFFLEDRP